MKTQERKEIEIRSERPQEYRAVESLLRDAFWDVYRPGCSEHFIVHRLREDGSYLPELSAVAVLDEKIVGCIFYSKQEVAPVLARSEDESKIPDLQEKREVKLVALGPVAVLPEYQKQGIGSALIRKTQALAKSLGYLGITLYGELSYYSRFGFKLSSKCGLGDSQGKECSALLISELEPQEMRKSFPCTECQLGGSEDGGRMLWALKINPIFLTMREEEIEIFDSQFPKREKHVLSSQIF